MNECILIFLDIKKIQIFFSMPFSDTWTPNTMLMKVLGCYMIVCYLQVQWVGKKERIKQN